MGCGSRSDISCHTRYGSSVRSPVVLNDDEVREGTHDHAVAETAPEPGRTDSTSQHAARSRSARTGWPAASRAQTDYDAFMRIWTEMEQLMDENPPGWVERDEALNDQLCAIVDRIANEQSAAPGIVFRGRRSNGICRPMTQDCHPPRCSCFERSTTSLINARALRALRARTAMSAPTQGIRIRAACQVSAGGGSGRLRSAVSSP